ncbi:MAG: hypothetical protein KAR09_03845, partial [Bacteroidales bacterium]|nr:hypothetical protein [Bacteroidales bacterium]
YLTINTASQSYGEITAGGDGVQSYNISTSILTPPGYYLEFTFDIEATGGITAQGIFSLVVGQMPILIIDLDGTQNSGPHMYAAIQDLEVGVDYVTSWPDNVGIYSSVFVCLGIYSQNHVLSSGEGTELANFLDAGGNLYIEGGDTWYYDPETPVRSMFNINATNDGDGDTDVLSGLAGTFTEGMTFNYAGDNSYMDRLAAIAPAFNIFENNYPVYYAGVAYETETYRTIGCSFEFGGLAEGSGISTKQQLMEEYLDFFGLRKVTDAPGTPVGSDMVCPNSGDIPYTTNSVAGADIYYWSIEPENAGVVTGADTAVTIAWSVEFNGMAYVRVCGMNTSGIGPVSDSLEVTVLEAPTATITGNETICAGEEAGLTVTLTGVAPWLLVINAESYSASASPWTFNVSPGASTAYTVTSVEDAVGCTN